MIDLIFAVQNSKQWHAENLQKNPSHYSFLMRACGANAITTVQRNYGAKIYYNTLVPIENSMYKYGVIEMEDLLNDLEYWDNLYCAGRLHKPVTALAMQSDAEAQIATKQAQNLHSAVRMARLLLPETFTEEELYMKICALSYMGDVRMRVGGENVNKVRNIVRPNILQFRQLYEQYVNAENLHLDAAGKMIQQRTASERINLVMNLPRHLFQIMARAYKRRDQAASLNWVNEMVANSEEGSVASTAIATIISRNSTTQTLKGLLTAGVRKSVRYALAKLQKGRKKE